MSREKDLEAVIANLVSTFGVDAVVEAANAASARLNEPLVCTIIVNRGIHNFPREILTGEVFTFSEGNMDFSRPEAVKKVVTKWLVSLVEFLKSHRWKTVNLIISGHPVLNMLVKMVVYRVSRIDTVDWIYDNEGGYFPLHIKIRDIAIVSPSRPKSIGRDLS